MQTRWFVAALAAVASIGFLAGTGFSDDPAPGEEAMKKMMEEMLKLGEPGEAQERMQAMVGTWDGTSKFWMPTGGEPVTSKSTSVNKLILGGRILVSDYTGEFQGMPFNGMGLMAHDNFLEQYQGLWVDSWSSGMYWETGGASEDGKTITMNGSWEGPQGKMDMRHVWVLVGPDEYRMESYMVQGEEAMKNMEIVFKRRKPAPSVVLCAPRHVPSKGPGY